MLEGEYVRVGRTDQADYVVAADTHLSRVHFLVECGPTEARLRDLKSSNGTQVNGTKVIEATLKDGDLIAAGQSVFRLRVEQPSPAAENAASASEPLSPDFLLGLLRGQFQPLYALLDAARDIKIYALLLQCNEERQSLYEGAEGDKLAMFAPYLVRLQPDSALLESVVRQGWGKSWGVYLTCPSGLVDVRRHFRHFLKVKKPDGKVVYFRFYDPRVLRVYLPTCTPQELDIFFGPVTRFVGEHEQAGMMVEFTRHGARLKSNVWRPSGPGAAEAGKVDVARREGDESTLIS